MKKDDVSFKISLALLSKYRMAIMGVAATMIMVFHANWCYDNEKMGFLTQIIGIWNCGVDIFLFVSGIGLYYSFSKDENLIDFYSKRFVNVLPISTIIVALYIYIETVVLKARDFQEVFTETLLIGHPNPVWYIILIVFLYLAFPLIYSIYKNDTKVTGTYIILACIMIVIFLCYAWVALDEKSYRHIEISLTRIPSFLIGCLIGKKVKNNVKSYCWILFFIAAFAFETIKILLPSEYNNVSSRFRGSCIGIFLCFLLSAVFDLIHNNKIGRIVIQVANFFGKMSLELYLVHNLSREVFEEVGLLSLKNYLLILFCSIIVCIPLSRIRKTIYNSILPGNT